MCPRRHGHPWSLVDSPQYNGNTTPCKTSANCEGWCLCGKLDSLMDNQLATIWVKVGQARGKTVTSGGVYREFHQTGTDDNTLTRPQLQLVHERRWARIIKVWKNIKGRCVVIGDMNMDHLKWDNPDPSVSNMVEKTPHDIEGQRILPTSWNSH